ncbi:uncharacterized protein LOC111876803 [Lactuca sativa]|uniref:uncharacterized protein LOC111876803 n=1 Tax=Lactuca sativa TaxID=4236 RepID=UPI000CD9D143|nr:uncharacterized protein LOC111876803 [Lactuca sativa]
MSGQTEVTNRALKRILERSVGSNRKEWSDKLDDALRAFRTAFNTPIGTTPSEFRTNWLMQLNAFEDLRNEAYTSSLIYKEKTKKWHDKRLKGNKDFYEGQKVLLFNSRIKLFLGKLRTRWDSPFIVKKFFPHGAIELISRDGTPFKVNGHRVKKYEEGIPRNEEFEEGMLLEGITET